MHAVGGIIGAVLTGVFASAALGGVGIDGSIFDQVGTQFIGVAATFVYCGIATFVLLKIIDSTMGLRVNSETESEGLDLALHNERGYNI